MIKFDLLFVYGNRSFCEFIFCLKFVASFDFFARLLHIDSTYVREDNILLFTFSLKAESLSKFLRASNPTRHARKFIFRCAMYACSQYVCECYGS